MGLNAIIEQAVDQAFLAAKDLVGSGTLVLARSGNYDVVNDRVGVGVTEISGLRMLRTTADQRDMDVSQASIVDYKILVPKKDLKGIKPTTADIVKLDGFDYNIARVKDVPGTSLYALMCMQR